MAASSDPKLKPLPGIFNSRLPAIVAGAESLGVAGTSPATTSGYSLQRRRGDIHHVRAGAGLRRRLGPVDLAAQVGGGCRGFGQRDGDALLILGSAAWQLPHRHTGLGLVVGVDALITGTRRGHHGRVRRDVEADRYAFRDHAFSLQAVIPNRQGVGYAAGTGLAFAESPRQRYANANLITRPEVDRSQRPDRQARPGVVAHLEVGGGLPEQSTMLGHRGGVIVNEVRKVIECHVDRAHVTSRSVELWAMALGAADVDQVRLTGRSAGGNFDPPLAGFRHLRQRGEVRGQIRGILVAKLAFHERRHDAPRLVHRAGNLCRVQPATGEIRSESTLAVAAVALPAQRRPRGCPLPICLSRRGTARGLSRNPALRERYGK